MSWDVLKRHLCPHGYTWRECAGFNFTSLINSEDNNKLYHMIEIQSDEYLESGCCDMASLYNTHTKTEFEYAVQESPIRLPALLYVIRVPQDSGGTFFNVYDVNI